MRSWWAALALLGLLMAGCGQGASTSSPAAAATPHDTAAATVPSSPAPTASRQPSLIAIHTGSTDNTIEIVRPDASVVTSISGTFAWITSAAGRIFFIESAGLSSVDYAGTIRHLGAITPGASPVPTIAVSPDGTRWAWPVVGPGGDGSETTIYVGGSGVATRSVVEKGDAVSIWRPIRWTQAGILLTEQLVGIGGCCYLPPESGYKAGRILDPDTLQTRDLVPGCAAADLGDDGSYGCAYKVDAAGMPGGQPEVVHPDGTVTTVRVPPGVRSAWMHLSPDHARLALADILSVGRGGGDGPYDINAYTAGTADGAASLVGMHETPAGWLADGSLVVESAPAIPDGTPSVRLIKPGGAQTEIGVGSVAAISP